MSIIKLDQNLDPTFSRATTANYKDLSATAAASGVIRYENVVDAIVIDTKREWDRGTHSNTSGYIDNTLNLVNTSASGLYTSEVYNVGVTGAVLSSHALVSSGSVTVEFRGTDSDSLSSFSSWSTTKPSTKYVQFRLLMTNGTPNPVVSSLTITPTSLGKAVTIEESTVNLLTSPAAPATQDVTVTASGDYALSIYGTDAASGTCVIEHKKVETTTADFDAGTLSNVDGTGNALAMATAKATPSFTRATSSTNYDGSTVTSGNARYYPGKNLLSKNQSDFETNTTGWTGTNATISRDTTNQYSGAGCLKVVCNADVSGEGAYTNYATTGNSNQFQQVQHVASAYVKGDGTTANGYIRLYYYYKDGTAAYADTAFAFQSSYTRYQVVTTPTKPIRDVEVQIRTNGSYTLNYYIDNVQLEIGSSATDWVHGGPHAIMIEEASTNLLAANTENFNTNWSGYNGSSGAITSGQSDPFGGTSAYRVQTTGGSSTLKWYAGYGPGTNGLKYSHCIWIKNNDASNAMTVKSNMGSMSTTVNNSDGWVLVKQENITSDGVGIQHIQFQSAAAGTNVDVTCMWPKIEQKAYCTTYIAPGSTRNAEVVYADSTNIFTNKSVGSAVVRFKINVDGSAEQTLLDLGGTGVSGFFLYMDGNTDKLIFQYGTGSGVTFLNSTTSIAVNTWYTVGIKWGPTGAKLFLNGTQESSNSTVPIISTSANYIFGSNLGTVRFLNGQLDTVALYREELTDAELASATASSGSIQLDRRTAYDLRFVNNLNHGEGGYRLTTGVALDNIRTIGGSTIDWSATTPAGTSGIIETSIDNGSTWSTATDASTITGLTDGVSATGKTFICRQTLLTEDTTYSPTLDDIEYRITQKWANTQATYIKPIYTTLRFTPTNLTKFQLENKKYSTSFYDGTRNADDLTIAAGVASGIINGASGAVIVRFWHDGDDTVGRNRVLFSIDKGNASGQIIMYQVLGAANRNRCYLSSDTGTVQSASEGDSAIVIGWHTIGITWSMSALKLYFDGSFQASGVVSSSPTIASSHVIRIGREYVSNSFADTQISQVDIFSETLTDAEMIAYTAATGAVIPVGIKHSYQMKFEDSLAYGTCGKFTSRWQDAGSNCAGTPWVTYSKVDSTPGTTSITYQFKASDDQDDSDSWTTDITSITGRYLKVRFNLISDDVDANTPTITSFRAYPEYS